MATTPVEFYAPSGLTLTGELYPFGSDTIANGAGGDSATEKTNCKGLYSFSVTQAISGNHNVRIKDGSGNTIANYFLNLNDDTTIYRCHDNPPEATAAASSQIADAVWDEAHADHTTGGTFGGNVARTIANNRPLLIGGAGHAAVDWGQITNAGSSVTLSGTTVGTCTANTDMRGTDNAALASVVGALADTTSAGDPGVSTTLVSYAKQLINTLEGTAGIPTFPGPNAPGNNVSLAEIIHAIADDVIGLNGEAMRGTDGANTTTPPTAAAVADQVWDESTVGHTTVGTFGEQCKTDIDEILVDVTGLNGDAMRGTDGANTTTPPTSAAIADAVWDETSAGHTDAGKAGEQLWTDVDAILVDTTGLNGDAMRGTDDALLAASAPTNWSSMVISVAGSVDALVQGFLNNTIAESSGDRIAGNFEVFWDNADALTTKVVDNVGGSGGPTSAQIADAVWDETSAGHTDAGKAGAQLWTKIDDIVADTNELQTDWTDGGRLDLIVDAILVDTGTTLDDHLTDVKGTGFVKDTHSLTDILADVTGLNGDVMRGTDNAALASVVGALADTTSAGDPGVSTTLVSYAKQLINTLEGTAGIPTFPGPNAPGNNVSLAEIIHAIADDVIGLNGEAMRGTDNALLAASAPTNWSSMSITVGGTVGINWGDIENKNASVNLSNTIIALTEDLGTLAYDGLSDAIWDKPTAGHTIAGTFGEQCKTDIDDILADVTGINGEAMRGTDDALLAASAPTNWSSMVISVAGSVDALVQGFLDNTIIESTADRIAGNFETFWDNADAQTTSVVDDVGTGSSGAAAWVLKETTIATLTTQTDFTLTDGSTDDDAYNRALVVITNSATSNQKAVGRISDYVGSTKQVLLAEDPGIFTIAVGDNVTILADITSLATNAEVVDVMTVDTHVDGKTFKQAHQIIGAVVAGKITDAGAPTETFLGLDGVTTRVTVTVDTSGNRSSVVYA